MDVECDCLNGDRFFVAELNLRVQRSVIAFGECFPVKFAGNNKIVIFSIIG